MLDSIISAKGHSSPLLFLPRTQSASYWLNGSGEPELPLLRDEDDNAALETERMKGVGKVEPFKDKIERC